MKTDQELQKDVQDAIAWQPLLHAKELFHRFPGDSCGGYREYGSFNRYCTFFLCQGYSRANCLGRSRCLDRPE